VSYLASAVAVFMLQGRRRRSGSARFSPPGASGASLTAPGMPVWPDAPPETFTELAGAAPDREALHSAEYM
jgi:hypothetical protein